MAIISLEREAQTFTSVKYFNQQTRARPFEVQSEASEVTNAGSTDSTSAIGKSESDFPSADRGKAAWLFLAGSFWLEGIVWGK